MTLSAGFSSNLTGVGRSACSLFVIRSQVIDVTAELLQPRVRIKQFLLGFLCVSVMLPNNYVMNFIE